MSDRRDFLKTFLAGGAAVLLARDLAYGGSFGTERWPPLYDDPNDPWSQVPEILKRINAPVFPDDTFDVTNFGSVGDGKTEYNGDFRKEIEECNEAGNGRVVMS